MKRRIVITCLLLISFSFLMSEINFGAGIGIGDYQSKGPSGEFNVAFWGTVLGFDVFIEYLEPLKKAENSNLSYGVGAGYLFPRKIGSIAKFGFIPIYLIGQYNNNWKNKREFYGKLKAGFDFFYGDEKFTGENTDLSWGLYTGISGGLILANNVFFELSYQQYRGKKSYDYDDGYCYEESIKEITLSHVTLSLGIQIK